MPGSEGRFFRNVTSESPHHLAQRTATEMPTEQNLFQGTFDFAAIGMALVGLDGRWLKVNDALARLLGYRREELLQSNFQSITHTDDLAADLALVRRLLDGEIPSYELEKRYVHKEGRTIHALLTVTLVRSPDGAPRFFLSQLQDMTAEKRLQTEAKMFFESSSDMLAIAGLGDTLEVVNDAWRRVLGWSVRELTTTPFLDFVHPDDRERTTAESRAVYGRNPSTAFRNRYRAKDGSYRWLEWNTQSTSGGRLYCVVRDVTTEHEVALALQASERRFRGLAEGSIQGIVVLRDEIRRRPLYANAVAARIFGFPSAEAMVATPSLGAYLISAPPPPKSIPFNPSRPPLRRGSASDRIEMLRRDGARIWVDVLRTRIEWDGDDAVQLTLVDVTEQVRLEMSLERSARVQRAMARHLPKGAVLLFDQELRCILADGSALEASMGLPRTRVEGRRMDELVSRANREQIVGAYRDALRGIEQRQEATRSGRTFDILIAPIRDDYGAVIGGMAVAYDVTERKQEADELRAARTLLALQADSLREQSHVDPLTGALNRRGFLRTAEERRVAAGEESDAHVLLFVDLDGMKPINDELGHQAGDDALCEAATILAAAASDADVVGRLGGDEFALLMVGAGTEECARKRIEIAIATANSLPGRRFTLSMSIGAVVSESADPRSLDTLLTVADARMYEQKRERRTRPSIRKTHASALLLDAAQARSTRMVSSAPPGL